MLSTSDMYLLIAMAYAINPDASIKSALYLEYDSAYDQLCDLMLLHQAIEDSTENKRSAYSTANSVISWFNNDYRR